jgi:hypothetical protein
MESQYLQKTVGGVVSEAISELISYHLQEKGHPQDPIDFVAHYLLEHAAINKQLSNEREEELRVKNIQMKLQLEKSSLANHLKTVRLSVVEAALMRKEKQERLEREALQKIEEERILKEQQEAEAAEKAKMAEIVEEKHVEEPIVEETSEAVVEN